MKTQPVVSTDAIAAAFVRALGMFVGQGKPYPVAVVGEQSGVGARNIYAYMESENRAPIDAIFSVMKVMPPSFAAIVLAPAEIAVASRDPEALAAMELVTKLAGGTAAFAEAAKDGRIDHIERGKLKPIAREIACAMHAIADDA